MDTKEKLAILADAAKYDASCASSGSKRANTGGIGSSEGNGICHSYTPDGRCVSLLKILLTNMCIFDCSYCVNRLSNDVKRARFGVKEIVDLTLEFYRRNFIEGLFLSSGIFQSPDRTMEELVKVARTLREEHGFAGYIHLKAVAGASPELLQEAGLWADRLSANIELPTQIDLDALAPAKSIEQTHSAMGSISERIAQAKDEASRFKSAPAFARAGQSTQLIVGATASPDATILETASTLYNKFGLKRVYYTAYTPIENSDPRLPAKAPPLVREHRLYQADWLLRHYGFSASEIVTPEAPQLDLRIDPKLAWALRNLSYFPVDLNRAPQMAVLRVPGLGVRSVKKLIALRRTRKIRRVDLARLGVDLSVAGWFVETADASTPGTPDNKNVQLRALDAPDFSARFLRKPKPMTLFDEPDAESDKGGDESGGVPVGVFDDPAHLAATGAGEF